MKNLPFWAMITNSVIIVIGIGSGLLGFDLPTPVIGAVIIVLGFVNMMLGIFCAAETDGRRYTVVAFLSLVGMLAGAIPFSPEVPADTSLEGLFLFFVPVTVFWFLIASGSKDLPEP